MSSSGVAYPPPSYPPVSIFNAPNYPPIPPAGTATSNNFPNGINLTGTNGSARTITGISNLDFVSESSTTASGLLTQISQNDTQMTIGTPNPAGTIEIDIYGSALLFNGVAVGTGTGNVSTTADNTFVTGTNQEFYNATIDNSLTFPNNNTPIIFDDTLQFQNTNSPTYPLLLNNTSSDEWSLLYSNPVNFNLNFPNKTIDIIAQNINLTASTSVSVSSILISPNSPTITIDNLSNGNGTFYSNSQAPYFAYNNAGSITNSPLVVSSTLNNYATLGTNTFTGTNTFNNINITNTSGINFNTNIAQLSFPSTFPNGITTGNTTGLGLFWNNNPTDGEVDMICYGQGGTNPGLRIYASSTSLTTTQIARFQANNIQFFQNPTITATQLPANDNSTKIATTAWVQTAIPSLTNTPTLSGNNPFIGTNNFSQYITNATQSLITTTSIPANQATFFGRAITGNVVPYFGWTDGTNVINYQLPVLSLGNTFTTTNTFNNGINLPNQISIPTGTNLGSYNSNLYYGGNKLAYNNSPTFTGNPTAPTPLTGDNSTSIATTAFVQASLPTPKVIFNTPNNTIINTNIVSWVFTIPSTTFLGNNFTWNAYSLIPVVIQDPVIYPIPNLPLSPSGTSLFFSGNGILQPFQVQNPPIGTTNGYVFSVINSIGIQTIAFQSLITNSGDINYTLQITFPSGTTGLNKFTLYPSPLKFEIQPISIATFPS
jgi:hypothetical protein